MNKIRKDICANVYDRYIFLIVGEGEFIDLEKTFKKQFENLDDKALEVVLKLLFCSLISYLYNSFNSEWVYYILLFVLEKQ